MPTSNCLYCHVESHQDFCGEECYENYEQEQRNLIHESYYQECLDDLAYLEAE